jgi:hypothetical protein
MISTKNSDLNRVECARACHVLSLLYLKQTYKYEFRKLHPIPMLFTIYFLGSFWESFCALLRLGLGQASETVPLGFGRWTNGAGHICIWDWEAVSRKASVRFAGDKGRLHTRLHHHQFSFESIAMLAFKACKQTIKSYCAPSHSRILL